MNVPLIDAENDPMTLFEVLPATYSAFTTVNQAALSV